MNHEAWQFEIPSVEHPRLLRAVLDEADARGVRIRRVSMGSGLQYLTDSERAEYRAIAAERDVDAYIYSSSRNSFEPLVDGNAGEQLRGEEAFAHALDELRRCADEGFAGALVADIGLLAAAGELRARGELGGFGLKAAAALAPHNAASAAALEQLGATSINVATSATRDALAAMRSAVAPTTTIDIYVEAPQDLGAGVRYRDSAWLVAELAPVYLKIGIRNAPSLYPYGMHMEAMAVLSMREKVRRAELVLHELARAGVAPLGVGVTG